MHGSPSRIHFIAMRQTKFSNAIPLWKYMMKRGTALIPWNAALPSIADWSNLPASGFLDDDEALPRLSARSPL